MNKTSDTRQDSCRTNSSTRGKLPRSSENDLCDLSEQMNDDTESLQTRFGMWLFLAMETLFFGAFFLIFAVSQHAHAADFKIASHHLNQTIAIINTVLLLTSSLTMAIAVQTQKNSKATHSPRGWMIATCTLGLAFLALKLFEYHLDAQEALLPFVQYAPNFKAAPPVYQFFSLYFLVTLIHFAHLTIGCVWLLVLTFKKNLSKTAVETAGLYWHFVDVIWILLLPSLYLIQ